MGLSATQLARIQSRTGEQRLSSRRRIAQPFPIELLPGKTGLLYDLSGGGLSVVGVSGLETGTTTYMRFHFPETNSMIDAAGVIAWIDSGRTGVRFTRVEPHSTEPLKQWLRSDGTTDDMTVLDAANQDSELTNSIASLQEISALQALISSQHLDQAAALDLIVRRTMELTRATGAAIVLREGEDAICRASAGNAPDIGVKLSSTSLTGECFRTGAMVVLKDSETDKRVNPEICRQLNYRSLVIVPVAAEEQTIGIVEAFSPNPDNFAGGDVLVLSFVAELIAGIAAPARQENREQAITSSELESILHTESDNFTEIHEVLPESVLEEAASEPVSEIVAVSESQISAIAAVRATTASSASVVLARASGSVPVIELPLRGGTTGLESKIGLRRTPLVIAAIITAVLLILAVALFSSRSKKTAALAKPPARPAVTTTSPAAQLPSTILKTGSESNTRTSSPLRAVAVRQPASINKAEATSRTADEIQINHGASVLSTTSAADAQAPEAPPVGQMENMATAALTSPIAAPVLAPGTEATSPVQSKGVVPGGLLRKVAPKYPEMARRAGVSGDVVLAGTIGTDGNLHNLKVLSGSPLLQSEAVAAAKQWRYTPYLLNGKAIETDTRITISFHR